MKQNPTQPDRSDNPANPGEKRSENLEGNERLQNSEGENEEFPGYPHYPAQEDIMHPANKMEKIAPDPEKLTRSGAYLDKKPEKPVSSSLDTPDETGDDLVIVPGTEADVTRDDLIILGEQNIENDEEDTTDSKTLLGDLDAELDVPGEELDDANEEIGEEDEENNYYSLGGDSKENLEENN
ncbi:MAG TPA: hypothetical protein VKA49_05330 [Flavitalea sp.]|nr:hypothetical protein [Flavitalea sp.]